VLIRVPCPGGRAARTGGWLAAVRASSAVLSTFTAGGFGVLASGGLTGAETGTLEILLMDKTSGFVTADCDEPKTNAL
jgi:hypothetical protein